MSEAGAEANNGAVFSCRHSLGAAGRDADGGDSAAAAAATTTTTAAPLPPPPQPQRHQQHQPLGRLAQQQPHGHAGQGAALPASGPALQPGGPGLARRQLRQPVQRAQRALQHAGVPRGAAPAPQTLRNPGATRQQQDCVRRAHRQPQPGLLLHGEADDQRQQGGAAPAAPSPGLPQSAGVRTLGQPAGQPPVRHLGAVAWQRGHGGGDVEYLQLHWGASRVAGVRSVRGPSGPSAAV